MTRGAVRTTPKFDSARFECHVYGLKANSSGDWLLTVKIDSNAAMELGEAFGMAIITTMERRQFSAD